ncbi:hypothetical protein ACFQZI_13200 [Mucilaginibacter lutimaris]|uniref:Uncharacterized protein n=1 Tax=Mucilaginibacter lutimaris TaxID=931629 RepID=A0ABW2ZHZ4_9SPHI
MARNYYRITLYNTQFFTELVTYKFPILPSAGDMIEVINQRTMFVVQGRSFLPYYEAGLIEVMLHGVFENGEDMGKHTFDKIRVAIRDEQDRLRTMDCTTNFNGFPSSLD